MYNNSVVAKLVHGFVDAEDSSDYLQRSASLFLVQVWTCIPQSQNLQGFTVRFTNMLRLDYGFRKKLVQVAQYTVG